MRRTGYVGRVSRLRSPLDIFAVVLVVVGYLNDRKLHDGQAAKQVERSAMMIRTGYVGRIYRLHTSALGIFAVVVVVVVVVYLNDRRLHDGQAAKEGERSTMMIRTAYRLCG